MDISLKDRVLESTDLVDLVSERVSLTRKGKDFLGLCPFHNDHNASLAVSPTKQIFKCWACGVGGDAIKFVMLSQRVEFREALRFLAERAGIELGRESQSAGPPGDRDSLRHVLEWARSFFQRNLAGSAGSAARAYAESRGLRPETIERHRLGLALDEWSDLYAAAGRAGVDEGLLRAAGLIVTNENNKTYDRFRGRLMFPIHDAMGRCVAFGGRTLVDGRAKYLNSPESAVFSKSRILFGLDLARSAIPKAGSAIVVEGYLDAVLLHQAGIENVVATLGTALTDAHVKLLRPLTDTVFLCFDGDEAGLRAADRAIETSLRQRMNVRMVVLPDGQDPADCVLASGAEGFTSNLQSAGDALEFKWRGMQRAFAGSGAFARETAVEEFIAFVARVSQAGGLNRVAEGVLVSRLADLLSIPARGIYERIAALRGSSSAGGSAGTGVVRGGGSDRVGRRGPDEAVRDGAEASEDSRTGADEALSAYDASIRGLPRGLVSAVEELFGCVLEQPENFEPASGTLATAVNHCPAWRRLLGLCEQVVNDHGVLSRLELVDAVDDASMFDLLERCRAAVPAGDTSGGNLAATQARVAAELELLRMATLRSRLRDSSASSADRDEALRTLTRLGQRNGGFLAAERRRSGPGMRA